MGMQIKALIPNVVAVVGGVLLALEASAVGVEKRQFDRLGKERTYYVYTPASPEGERPLILLLHDSGRTGLSLVERWRRLAKQEGVILVGPDSLDTEHWNPELDGGTFLRETVERVAEEWPVDRRRIYLFGHSSGADFALRICLVEADYFAAVATHAGLLQPAAHSLIGRASRKIPIAMWVGTEDRYVPLKLARQTLAILVEGGLPADLIELEGHTHWYYDAAPRINAQAWEFLQDKALE